jgi:hypothetical protein
VVLTILKNMKVNGKDYPIYEMGNKTCLKPPTSHGFTMCFSCCTRHFLRFNHPNHPSMVFGSGLGHLARLSFSQDHLSQEDSTSLNCGEI